MTHPRQIDSRPRREAKATGNSKPAFVNPEDRFANTPFGPLVWFILVRFGRAKYIGTLRPIIAEHVAEYQDAQKDREFTIAASAVVRCWLRILGTKRITCASLITAAAIWWHPISSFLVKLYGLMP